LISKVRVTWFLRVWGTYDFEGTGYVVSQYPPSSTCIGSTWLPSKIAMGFAITTNVVAYTVEFLLLWDVVL